MNEELKVIDILDEIPEEVLSAHEDVKGEDNDGEQ